MFNIEYKFHWAKSLGTDYYVHYDNLVGVYGYLISMYVCSWRPVC